MIANVLINHLCCLLFYTLVAEVILYLFIQDYLYGVDRQKNMELRLEGYARLGLAPGKTLEKSNNNPILSAEGHQILLGTLKKVEQKNATLVTVLVFLEGAFLAIYTQADDCSNINIKAITWAAFAALPALFMALFGTRHLDLGHLKPVFDDRRNVDPLAIAEILQRDLLSDLDFKERNFKFSWYVTSGTLFLLFFMLLLHLR